MTAVDQATSAATTAANAAATTAATADQTAERVFSSVVASFEALSIYLGDRLGWYRSLAAGGPATPAELAAATGTAERYAREWLEQQATSGILVAHSDDDERRYELPVGAAEALTDQQSLAYAAPMARLVAVAGAHLPELLNAYRSGGGVSWEQLGTDAREAQADLNRPWFSHRLADALHGVPDVDTVLSRRGARIVDVGCGAGWSTIALAKAYPAAQVDGVDVDLPSVAMASRNADAAGLTDRVRFRHADAGSLAPGADGAYDAAFAFECLHDMSRPVEVLAAVRAAVRSGGLVVVMDEAVADELVAPGDDVERFMYGCSLFICLPDGLSAPPSAGTGTVMRSGTLRAYAQQAGFNDVDVLPIEDFSLFRFYRLR